MSADSPNDRNHGGNGQQPIDHHRIDHLAYTVSYVVIGAIIDFVFLWPEFHLAAILAFAALISMPTYAELRKLGVARNYIFGAIFWIFAFAGEAYLIVGPNLPGETPIHGRLLPAHEAAAKTACGEYWYGMFGPLEDESKHLTVALGNSGVQVTYWRAAIFPHTPTAKDVEIANWWNSAQRTILQVGTCPAIKVRRRAGGGISIDADVFTSYGLLAARIRDNEFNLVPAQIGFGKRPDRSTLTVTGTKGEELFWARFLNPRSLKIRGYFGCRGVIPTHIAEDRIEMADGSHMANMCVNASPKGVAFFLTDYLAR